MPKKRAPRKHDVPPEDAVLSKVNPGVDSRVQRDIEAAQASAEPTADQAYLKLLAKQTLYSKMGMLASSNVRLTHSQRLTQLVWMQSVAARRPVSSVSWTLSARLGKGRASRSSRRTMTPALCCVPSSVELQSLHRAVVARQRVVGRPMRLTRIIEPSDNEWQSLKPSRTTCSLRLASTTKVLLECERACVCLSAHKQRVPEERKAEEKRRRIEMVNQLSAETQMGRKRHNQLRDMRAKAAADRLRLIQDKAQQQQARDTTTTSTTTTSGDAAAASASK